MTAPQVPDVEPATGQLSGPVLDSLAGQLDSRARQRRAEQDRAKAAGGPCSRCGCVLSFTQPGVGGWHHDAHGPVCVPCWVDLGLGAVGGGSEHEARAKAARLVLGSTPAPAWAGHGTSPAARWWHDDYLADAFQWFHEAGPDARPGQGPQRFAYCDPTELLDRLYRDSSPKPPVLHDRGKRIRCEGCGARGRVWTVTQVAVAAVADSHGDVRSNRAYFRLTWTCRRCHHTETEQRATQLPGVPVSGLAGG